MKIPRFLLPVVVLLASLSLPVLAAPAGTAFTYQGRLSDAGQAANGSFDVRAILFNSDIGGSQVGPIVTVLGVDAVDGVFTADLDFGQDVFTGEARWVELSVRRSGVASFARLDPRQPIRGAPFAQFALTPAGPKGDQGAPGSAGPQGVQGLAGPKGDTGSSGATGPQGTKGDKGDTGAAGAIGLQGPVGPPGSDDAWSRSGNAGTVPGVSFLGTTDNQPLEFKVNGVRALRLEPTPTDPSHEGIVNVVGGSAANIVGPGVYGATIAGGGAVKWRDSFPYINRVDSHFGTVGGGFGNRIEIHSDESTIAGGWANQVSEAMNSTIGGGDGNWIMAGHSAIGGGYHNTILTGSNASTIDGGWANKVYAFAGNSTIGGGRFNQILNDAADSTIGGGEKHTIAVNAKHSTIGGGLQNTIGADAGDSTIGGGDYNTIEVAAYGSSIGGGVGNIVRYGTFATIAGGRDNLAGYAATSSGDYSSVGGGQNNNAQGNWATVPGGVLNWAAGHFSFAAGRRAKALETGSFVWADSTDADFGFPGANKFQVRASGGVLFYANAAANVGVYLAPGGNSWAPTSDRDAKENFREINPQEVLAKVVALPVLNYNLKSQTNAIRHLGPMAQDFYAAFQVGEDDKHITTIDADGVALAAIQGLNQKVEERNAQLEEKLAAQEATLRSKDTRIAALEQSVAELKQLMGALASEIRSSR